MIEKRETLSLDKDLDTHFCQRKMNVIIFTEKKIKSYIEKLIKEISKQMDRIKF